MKSLSKAQEARVKRERKAFQAEGASVVQDFKSLTRLILIKDNKVTTEDDNLAKKVCSPDVRSLKEKSARSKPAPVADNAIEILDELINANGEFKLSTDSLSVNSLNFAATIAQDLFQLILLIVRAFMTALKKCTYHTKDAVSALMKNGMLKVSILHC